MTVELILRISGTLLMILINIVQFHIITYLRYKFTYLFKIHLFRNYFEYYLNLTSKKSNKVIDAIIVLFLFSNNFMIYFYLNQFVLVSYILGIFPLLLLYSSGFPFSNNFNKYLLSHKILILYLKLIHIYFTNNINLIDFKIELRTKLSPNKIMFFSFIGILLMSQEFIIN